MSLSRRLAHALLALGLVLTTVVLALAPPGRTPSARVAGCHTYSERLPATASTEASSTRPGVPADRHGLGSMAPLGGDALEPVVPDGAATVPTRSRTAAPRSSSSTTSAPRPWPTGSPSW